MVNKLRSAMVTKHILHASCCCRPLDSGCGMTACRDSGMSFTPPPFIYFSISDLRRTRRRYHAARDVS